MGRHKMQIIEHDGQRVCTKCKVPKPLEQFNDKYRCKACVKQSAREQYIKRTSVCKEKSFLNIDRALGSGLPKATYDWFFNPNYCYG